ncbi:unnamed protein product [Fraxinus pennsylvanica]|uniref:Agenet domain-containing protein n=1 Tax=Fraxinus pennsylvanica TaxID=56036 RepID=A0AAD1ZHG6_9LAMI|nr:unnamed protein product [Fraxinus pennsylvanica]
MSSDRKKSSHRMGKKSLFPEGSLIENPPDVLDFGISNLRVHWDWVDGRWVRPVHQSKVALMFDVGKNVEVSIKEENYLNAWFPAIICEIVRDGSFVVELSQKIGNEAEHLKVTVDPLHVRPSPPHLKDKKYVLFEKIDAFFDGGWWSGVITKELEDSRYDILFKQPQKNRELHQSKIRPHMEWKDSKWTASSQDVLIPSSDSEKKGGHTCANISTVAVPVGSSGNGKDFTEEKMPRSLNSRENQMEQLTPCDQKLSHITTSITKRRRSLPSDFLDDLSLPLKKLKERNLEAAISLAPEQQNTLVTSSRVMLHVSASPISENTRIKSVKQSMLGDLSSNNPYQGQRIGKQQKVEKDNPTSGSKKKRGRTQEMHVKSPEYVVGGLATGKGSSSDKRDHPSIDKESLKPVSEQQQSNDSAIQRIKKRRKPQELQVKSPESVVGGLTTGKASSSDERDCPSIDKEPLKPVSEQEQQSNDSVLWRIKENPTSGSMKKRGRNQELQVKSPESVGGGLATGKASLCDNRDRPSIDKESLKPVSDQEQLSNDSAIQSIKESKQPETKESIQKRKRGRPRKMPIKSHQTQVTGSVQNGNIAADEIIIKDCSSNEVGSRTSAEVKMTGTEGSLYDRESTMHDKNDGLPKLKNRPGSIMKKTHRKASDAKAVEWSINPIEKHSSKRGRRRATDVKSAYQVQDSLDAPGSKTTESNHIMNELNEVIAGVPSREFDNKPLSKWIEEIQTPNAVDGSGVSLARTAEQCVEKEIALIDGSERQKESGMEIPISGDEGSTIQSEQLSLPFLKNAMLWSAIESMDIFRRIPQKPHFQPLQHTKESSREGLAIGLMVTFSSVVEKASRLQLNDPKSISDDILENLADLERYGFDVHAVRDRINGLLSVKDRKDKLFGQVEQLQSQIAEQNLERNHTDEEINRINEQIKNLQVKLSLAESAKEAKDRIIASSKSKLEELKQSIMTVACDFEELAATTL